MINRHFKGLQKGSLITFFNSNAARGILPENIRKVGSKWLFSVTNCFFYRDPLVHSDLKNGCSRF